MQVFLFCAARPNKRLTLDESGGVKGAQFETRVP